MSDDLDTLLRKAASAHLALAPASVLTTPGVDEDHDLIARAMRRIDDPAYLAQLEPFDPEALMMSDRDHDDDRDGAPAGRTTPPSSASDDSGLHDIRALAQNAKQRISRKMPVVKDSDDSLLASTTGQLKAIALPEPARLVMLPDMPSHPDAELARATAAKIEARGAAHAGVATAAEPTSLDARPKKRTALWLGLGGAAAAAAVIAVVASGGSKSKDKAAAAGAEAVAVTTPKAPTVESAAGGAGSGSAAPSVTIAAADPVAGGPASATPPAAPRADEGKAPGAAADRPERDGGRERGSAGAGAGDEPVKAAKPAATSAPGGAGAGSSKDPKAGTADKAGGDKPPADKGKTAGGAAAPTGDKGGGEKSIDDLLGDVGGSKPPPSGGDSGPKPEKKGLDGKDIKAGMAPLAGKAQGCYDQHGVAGHVKIKAIVDPSGKVTKVDATGEFAGTPTGSCVAGVVKAGASFPAWDGAPMTVNYSYTLNE